MSRSIFVFLLMPNLCAIQPVSAILPNLLFELPINDQPECADYSADCFERRGLCKNEAFKEIMRTKCAKTCKVCGEIIKDDYETIMVESPAPRHFGSHATRSLSPSMIKEWSRFLALNVDNDFEESPPANLMNVDATIDDLDVEDYGKSDEYLSESIEHQSSTILPPSAILQPPPSYPLPPSVADHQNVPSSFHRRRTCLDHAPNCFYLKSLCHNKFYMPIMRKNCEQTCNFCKVQHKKITHGKTKWTGIGKRPHSWHGQNENCKNRGLDCEEKINWCTHWRYWKFMRRICAASCGFCDVENDY